MDLSDATLDQIDGELTRRELPFSLIVSAKRAGKSAGEDAEYQLHSSLPTPVQQASHFLLGTLSIFATMAEELDEAGDANAEIYKRWQGVGEALLQDMLKKASEWESRHAD
jgi:hypothetical protein